MSGRVNPSVLEKWFALVGRWQEAETNLHTVLEQLDSDDPVYETLAAEARLKFTTIKRDMDALITSVKPAGNTGSHDFIAGSIDTSV